MKREHVDQLRVALADIDRVLELYDEDERDEVGQVFDARDALSVAIDHNDEAAE